MNYIEYDIATGDDILSEVLVAQLSDLPFEGFEQQDDCLKAFIPEEEFNTFGSEIESILRSADTKWSVAVLPDVNWNSEWESNFEPVDVGGECLIRAPFHQPAAPGYRTEIVIMPKMSFGTGHHATTWLMTSTIMKLDLTGLRGLDIGSGTGVLSIAAAGRGAAHIDAVDIDEWAYGNCMENITANGVADRIIPLLGDMSAVAGNRYDFILANINRNILMADMENYASALKDGGILMVSGILEKDADAIIRKAAEFNLSPGESSLRDGWAAVSFSKQ